MGRNAVRSTKEAGPVRSPKNAVRTVARGMRLAQEHVAVRIPRRTRTQVALGAVVEPNRNRVREGTGANRKTRLVQPVQQTQVVRSRTV